MTVTNITTIETIETDGAHWVHIALDGGELAPRGPYSSSNEAAVAAAGIAAICRCLCWSVITQAAPRRQREQRP